MFCALSGEPVKEAVVSPKSGAIFEKRLIESYIATTGKDPVTNDPLDETSLIPLQKVPEIVPPKPASFNSIPTMLAAFQNEWDALALETFTLRKQLHEARQELSHTLYQYDAAVRVAAKAIKERDEAKEALEQLSGAFASGAPPTSLNGIPNQLPVDELNAAKDSLFAIHKKQKVSLPITKLLSIQIGTSSINIKIDGANKIVADGTSGALMVASGLEYQLMPEDSVGNQQGIVDVGFLRTGEAFSPIAATAHTITDLRLKTTVLLDSYEIGSVLAHPSEPFLVAITKDGRWVLLDCRKPLYVSEPAQSVSASALHVDGVLLALGHESCISIVDITLAAQVATLLPKYRNVRHLQFGLNGYWLAALSYENDREAVQIFDLRKNSAIHEIELDAPAMFALDPSCLVLATYQASARRIQLHVYLKKGKLWLDRFHEIATDEFLAIALASSAESVLETKTFRIVGVADKHIVHHEISFL